MKGNEPVDLTITDENDSELKAIETSVEMLKYLSETRSYGVPMPDKIIFRVENDGWLIGEASLKSIRWFNRKAEVSLYLIPEAHGKGLAMAAMKKLIDYAFNQLHLYRLEAEIIEYNSRSARLAENLGFVKEGTLREAKFYNGRYYDIIRYGLLKKEYCQ